MQRALAPLPDPSLQGQALPPAHCPRQALSRSARAPRQAAVARGDECHAGSAIRAKAQLQPTWYPAPVSGAQMAPGCPPALWPEGQGRETEARVEAAERP